MLFTLIDSAKKSTFLLPFFIGAAVCSIFGGFFNLVMTFAVVYLSIKLISIVYKPANAKCV